MLLALFCGTLLSSIIGFLMYRILTINSYLRNQTGKLGQPEFHALTVELRQFLGDPDNEFKVAQFYRPSSNMLSLLEFLVYDYETPIIINKEEFLVSQEYMNRENEFGPQIFDISSKYPGYLPIKYKDTVFFSNYAKLNAFKWAIDSGVYQYIEDNKDETIEMMEYFCQQVSEDLVNFSSDESSSNIIDSNSEYSRTNSIDSNLCTQKSAIVEPSSESCEELENESISNVNESIDTTNMENNIGMVKMYTNDVFFRKFEAKGNQEKRKEE
jgi:hypothetical protein